jgi:hypothetical protein
VFFLPYAASIEPSAKIFITADNFVHKYQRPPLEEYQAHIIDRRDLLVPQNIREVKGSFFTPQIWVKKSQEYLTRVFGKKWQDEYYIWDCAAGTGNLLAGLKNGYNMWASTLDDPDVDSMKALLNDDEGSDGLKNDRIFNLSVIVQPSFDIKSAR